LKTLDCNALSRRGKENGMWFALLALRKHPQAAAAAGKSRLDGDL